MTQKASVRMEEIRRRTRRLRQRRAHRINYALSAVCLFLTVGIASLLYQEHVPGLSIVLAGYGSVLLHSGADAYIVVSVGFLCHRRCIHAARHPVQAVQSIAPPLLPGCCRQGFLPKPL